MPRCLRVGVFALLILAPVLLRSGVIELSGQSGTGVVEVPHASATGGFTFAAGGDIGAGTKANASLAVLDQSAVEFFVALGDLDYDQTPTDEAWCDYIKQRLPTLGPDFPFELLVGSHEDQVAPNGYILNHAACLPDRLGSTGFYGVQYHFDYPAEAPLMRLILIAPDLQVEGVVYTYAPGSAERDWLVSAIDGARNAGTPWVAVGMHKVCVTAGIKTCEISADLMNLLISKRIDLILQGHDHNYQRGKQLAHGQPCAVVPAGSFVAGCIADDGADNSYGKGVGSVIVVSGNVGICCYAVDPADPEAPYFAQMDSSTAGYTKFTVEASRLDVQFVPSTGTFTDTFSIHGDGDTDGDGFSDGEEAHAGTDVADNCGPPSDLGPPSPHWPGDLDTSTWTTNKLNVQDLARFIVPVRRMNSVRGGAAYSPRWDLNTDGRVGIPDIAAITTLYPPMFGGQRAFKGQECTP
ncbi:MAG TPA: hypothetical protein VGR43_00780 [Dehalococcoidia bacterium]|jgi:hypothetical protein|nr:hypothetical protein [Dehalococcoidia bacterium]